MRKFLDLGGYIGITGIVTFTQAENIREITKLIPIDRLLIETDAPYLAPKPYRGKKNHPKYLKLIAERIADIREMPLEELGNNTTKNALDFYGITEKFE